MTQQIINTGTFANDASGDPLQTAFQKINSNFTALFTLGANSGASHTFIATQGQTVFNLPAANVILVVLDGVFLIPSIDYVVSGSSGALIITLTTGVLSGQTLYVMAL